MNRIFKIAVLLLALVPLLAGCVKASPAGTETTLPPSQSIWSKQGTRPYGVMGLPMPVTLTDEDKDRFSFVARISSSVFEVEATSFLWVAIIWTNSSVVDTVWVLDEQTALKGIPANVNPNALWYPGVTLTHIEGNITYQMQVAYDYDSEMIVYSNGSYVPVHWGQPPITLPVTITSLPTGNLPTQIYYP